MAIPIILGGIALASAIFGAKKGIDAYNKNEEAKEIVDDAEQRFELAKKKLEEERDKLNISLEKFAKFKLMVFTTHINNLVRLLKKCKDAANSSFDSKNINFNNDLKELEIAVSNSLEIASGLGKGVTGGALTAMGAYGSVGLLATASTGTAISTLSGVAASNATLAWLGGGSLAAGGGGMALGTAVLGGIVAGPAIAITGFIMDSKAEQNLTDAYAFKSDIDIKIEQMELTVEGYSWIFERMNELNDIIVSTTDKFDNIYQQVNNISFVERIKNLFRQNSMCKKPEMEALMIIGKNLKMLLDIPLIDKDGNKNLNFETEIKKVTLQ